MTLNQKQKRTILDAIVAIDEERIRLNAEISECVTKGIKVRGHWEKLNQIRENLAALLKPSERVPKKRFPKLPTVPELLTK